MPESDQEVNQSTLPPLYKIKYIEKSILTVFVGIQKIAESNCAEKWKGGKRRRGTNTYETATENKATLGLNRKIV